MNELLAILASLQRAKAPEGVFGVPSCNQEELHKKVQSVFRKLAKVCHEDLYLDLDQKKIAKEAFQLLNGFWEMAEKKISQGSYGQKKTAVIEDKKDYPIVFKTTKYSYTITNLIKSGGMCGVFGGQLQDKKGVTSPIVVKSPHSPKDNDLMEREARACDLMKKKVKSFADNPEALEFARKLSLRVPSLLESIKLQEPGSTARKVLNTFLVVPEFETGWFSLEEIRAVYPSGVDTKIMAFIFNRALESLTLAHVSGLVHCAITPNHILIHAKTHSGQIVDWTASCRVGQGDKVPYLDDKYDGYFPEEIMDPKGGPSSASDLYMLAWCMVYVLGGNPQEKFIPDSVEKPIVDLLNKCLQPKRNRRPQLVEDVYREFRQIIKGLWGSRKFVELVMPVA